MRDPCGKTSSFLETPNSSSSVFERRVHQQLHSLAQFQELQLATTNTLAQLETGDQVKIVKNGGHPLRERSIFCTWQSWQIAVLLKMLKNDGENHGLENHGASSQPT